MKRKRDEKLRCVVDDFSGGLSKSVVGTHFSWGDNQYMGYWSFSVRNNLRTAVKNVYALAIFYDGEGLPIDTELVHIPGPVRGKLAKRSGKCGKLDTDVRKLSVRTEIRVLSFALSE